MPFIDVSYIEKVNELLDEKEAYVSKFGQFYEPFHGYYHRIILPKLEVFIGKNLKFQDFIDTLDVELVEMEKGKMDMFKNGCANNLDQP